jgi:hypothetical protein
MINITGKEMMKEKYMIKNLKYLTVLLAATVILAFCHEEDEGSKIEKLEFMENSKSVTVKVGQTATVGMKVSPEEARNSEKIIYEAPGSGSQYIEIDKTLSSNDGVVFTGKAVTSGSVITAKAGGITDYLQVKVEGTAETGIPYITVTDRVLEVPVGTKKHFISTLQNGNEGDYMSFVFSNSGQGIIDCEKANNTAVVTGFKQGVDAVTVRHPKAQYGVDVLVFVLEAGDFAKYITGESTVFMEAGGDRQYYTRLVGIGESEAGYSIYQVVEGNDVVTVSGHGEFCDILAKKEGVAKVRVTNRSAPYPFEFQVIVRGNVETAYISMSSNFIILQDAEIKNIYAYFNGSASGNVEAQYRWHFENNVTDVAEVTRYGNNFAVKALKNGTVKLIIENEYSAVTQEVLIIVQFEKLSGGEMFITTSQNVMHMELGGVDSVLKMKLVGGTQADKNNFEWVVEDTSIIEAAVPDGHGKVIGRAMASFSGEIQEASAKIHAKKAGTTYIIVTNTSAPRSEVRVLVKVYPQGMFSGNTVSLGGIGLLTVQAGKTLNVEVSLLGGSYQNTGELAWHINDGSIARADGAGLTGLITGLKAGNTELTVTGQNVLQEFRAIIVVYEEGQEDTVPYIYADMLQYKMYAGQTVYANIYHPNIGEKDENDEFLNDLEFSIVNTDTQVVYTVKAWSSIIIHAVAPGEAELVINTGIPGCNILTLSINVELAEINSERPFVITGDSSAITYIGGTVGYDVIMAGASESDLSRILWTIDDADIASLEMVNGTHVVLRGLQKGQTVLRAESAKSANVKEVIVFVAATQSDAYTKITMGLAKINYVLQTGESFFVKIVTNASETQKLQIRWGQSDQDILHVDANYDTAFITALEEGTCLITVDTRDGSHVMPLVLYVTVRSPVFDEFEIGLPSSVVLLKGQSKVIRGNATGASAGISDLAWSLEDDDVAFVIAGGLEATLWGRNPGQTFLTASSYGFSKKILVICVESENDLERVWYFTADKTYYRIKKNEEVRVNLLFGENGFPEDWKKNIDWKEDLNNGVITLSAGGSQAKVTGKNSGVARIIVSHELVGKDVEIIFEVIDSVTGSEEYQMLFPAVSKMVSGTVQTLTVSLYKDGHLYTSGYGLVTIETEGKGVVQTDSKLYNDTLRVFAAKEGREYITFKHPLAGESRMLVLVYEGQIPDDDPVIYVDKTYWSIYEGNNEFIPLQIAGGDENTKNGILWTNNDPTVISIDSSDKTRAKITGLSFGSAIIVVTFNGNIVEKIYMSVAKGNVATDIVVSTESIIIMALDTDVQHRTKIITGANVEDCNWEIKNEEIAGIYGFGGQCMLYAKSVGLTELTVSGYNYERKILVVVVQTEEEKMSAKYLNLDKRYYRLKRGESTVLYPYYKTVRTEGSANDPILHYNSGVINIERENESIVITGKNAGVELVTLGKEGYNEITIAVEVSEEISGGVVENTNLVYMTTDSNLLVLKPNIYGILVTVDVIGEYFGTNADFIWSKDSILLEWEVSGKTAFINTKDKTGEVNISVENKYCQYPLKIKIIIENDFSVTGSPHVYAVMTVYQLRLTDEAWKISFSVNNMETVDYSNVVLSKTGNAADAVLNGSYLEVKAKSPGVSEIEIRYPGAVSLKLYFIVSDNMENSAVYLTTAMNYVVVPKSKTKVIDVSLINYTELNSDNIKWTSSDYNTVTVVGNGRTVQAYGVKTGLAKLTVKHPASYNDLEILVKVVEENDMSNAAYLTTVDNIIETYVQNNSLQISVNKVGGILPELETTWTVDDPTIVSVMGGGGSAYMIPKKAGLAKITVVDKEAGKLDIVVIVKEAKAGTEYISTEEPVIQLSPGVMSSATVQVKLVGGTETDTKDFQWQIYEHLPSDYMVAKNGGQVISLFGMGDRASVQGNYVGTAKIRVSHPKAQLPLYIAVQVTNFNSLSFNENEAVILNGDIYFASIRVPNYENFMGKVEYSTDNPAVCVVTGSDKVALLQSQGVGKANITAIVRGTDLQATIAVTVIERDNYAEPNIIVPKTTYLLNPRERPFQIEAYLQGAGVTEESRYGLKWEALLYNGTDQESVWDAIEIYPSEKVEKEPYGGGETVEILRGTGPIIQVEVKNEKLPEGQTFQTKEIVIVVSQPEITSRTKTIYVKISEVSGIFTLDKSDIVMEPQGMVDLSCTILGGRASDYKEVVWITEVDSVGRKIADVMPNNGKDVRVYGVNDGTVYVTAMYRNEIAECRVQVKSSVYLKLQYEVFFTYPGARSGNNGPIEVDYEVRPFTAQITWTPRGLTPDSDDPIAEVEPIMQDWSTGKGKVRITPLKEGSFEIIGLTNRVTARMTVLVKNVYRLQFSNRYLRMEPGKETEYDPEPSNSYWDYDCAYNPKTHDVGGTRKVDGSIHIPFVVCPPDHRLVFQPATVALMEKYGIQYEISPILKRGEMEGRGIIKLTTTKEIPINDPGLGSNYHSVYGMILRLNLLMPLEDSIVPSNLYSSNENDPNNQIYVTSLLPEHQTALIPVFQRVFGRYSNTTNGVTNTPVKYKYYGGTQGVHWKDQNILTNERSNVSNGNAFDINNANWSEKRPTGVLPEFNNADYGESTSEYISLADKAKYDLKSSGHTAVYDLEIGDGEEHYILLDQTHEGMFYDIDNISKLKDNFNSRDFYKDKPERAPSAELATLDGRKAIRITGGSDYAVYDRVQVKNRKKTVFEFYSANNNILTQYDVSDGTNIKNWKTQDSLNENVNGYSVLDYGIVKRFGIPLNIEMGKSLKFVEDGTGEYVYKDVVDEETNETVREQYYTGGWVLPDGSIFDDNVVFQIVYLRKSDPYHPIRVQYKYQIKISDGDDGYGHSGSMRLETTTNITANDGGDFWNDGTRVVDFPGAWDFFSENNLYVTKADDRGNFTMRDKIPVNSMPVVRNLSYLSNPIVSKTNNSYISHEDMVDNEKYNNTHFDGMHNGVFYIVSDFDLESFYNENNKREWIVSYVGFSDFAETLYYPPHGNDLVQNLTFKIQRISVSRIFTRLFYSLKNMLFGFWADNGNHSMGGEGSGDFLNSLDGRYYHFDIESGQKFNMFMNENSLFTQFAKDKNLFRKITKKTNNSYRIGGIGINDWYDYPVDNLKQVNWRAIKSALIHNGVAEDFPEIMKAETIAAFKSNIGKYSSSQIFGYLHNAKGTVSTFIDGGQYMNYPSDMGYVSNTLYIKREVENGHNQIYLLEELGKMDGFYILYEKERYKQAIILEDITGNDDDYAPVTTEKTICINSVNNANHTAQLVITYRNSYSNNNKITINIKHRIYSDQVSTATGSTATTAAWGDVTAVQRTEAGNISYSNFSKIYNYSYNNIPNINYNEQGFFFEKTGY